MKRPVIAVSAGIKGDAGPRRVRLNAAYVTALENAGLVPVIIPPLASEAGAARVLEAVDGLLLTGGEDVAPEYFGQSRHSALRAVNAARDATELALIKAARESRKPTLAICRGIQVLNVAYGGTLIQDIRSQRPSALEHDGDGVRSRPAHAVTVEPGSRLAQAVGSGEMRVNSLHHQAVDALGEGLKVTARASDGIVEGVETDGDWWVLAVQWHPEEMDGAATRGGPAGGLFRAFADAAAERTPGNETGRSRKAKAIR